MSFYNIDLKDFNDVIKAFARYKNGGFWVKKLIFKNDRYLEVVNGPYDRTEALSIAEKWKTKFFYDDMIIAKAMPFKQLVCKSNVLIKNLVSKELVWSPPYGSKLFCVIYNLDRVLFLKKDKKQETLDFIKFQKYAEGNGTARIETKMYNIYFKKRDLKGYKIAKKLEYFFGIENQYSLEEREWVLSSILQTEEKGTMPLVLPGFLTKGTADCETLTINYFKGLNEKNNLEHVFSHLKKCVPPEKSELKLVKGERELVLETDFIINDNDNEIKTFYISKKRSEYYIGISDYNKSFVIGIENIQKGKGILILKFNESIEDFNKNFLSPGTDDNTEFIRITAMLFFIAICFKIDTIEITENLLGDYLCNNDNRLFPNIINYLAFGSNMFQSLGIKNSKEKSRITDHYRTSTLAEIYPELTSDFDGNMTINELATRFMTKDYNLYLCNVLTHISSNIAKGMNQRTFFNLKKSKLSFFRKFFF